MPTFEKSVELPLTAAHAFALHEQPGILEALSPPWEKMEVVQPPTSLKAGTEVVLRMKLGPVWMTWQAKHTRYEPPRLFEDVQAKGPFAKWIHQHRFEDLPGGRCRMTDHIEYALPLAPLSWPVDTLVVRRKLTRLFEFRHEQTTQLALAEASKRP
ncbi:MAG: SRPBCC family protein [Myxococcaceae bacterium]